MHMHLNLSVHLFYFYIYEPSLNAKKNKNKKIMRPWIAHLSKQVKGQTLFYSIPSHNLRRSSGNDRWVSQQYLSILCYFQLSKLSWRCPYLSTLWYCLPTSSSVCLFFLFPFTVPCRSVFAKPEDLEIWPNQLTFRFLTRVRSSSYSPMAAWIFLRTSS